MQAESTAVVAYVLQNHDQRVTIKDEAGKTLRAAQAGTPTLQLVVSVIPTVPPSPSTAGSFPAAQESATAKPRHRQVSLLLQDQNGLKLWSQLLPMAPQMHTFTLAAKWGSTAAGTRLELTFSTKKSEAAATSSEAEPPPIIMTIGADGQVVSMKGADKEVKFAADHNGIVLTSPNGSGDNAGLDFGKDGDGTFVINGVKTHLEQVTRSGKSYTSFPWNGHKVFVGNGCTFSVSSDGELTVDPPNAGK